MRDERREMRDERRKGGKMKSGTVYETDEENR